jgi:hypothetical protein
MTSSLHIFGICDILKQNINDTVFLILNSNYVQYLIECGCIKFGNECQVMLTQEDKDWCDTHCEAHLQRFNLGGY